MTTKALHRLTALQLAAAAAGTDLPDGGGLFYRSEGAGTGKWSFRYTSPDLDYRAAQAALGRTSIQRTTGFGKFPAVSLATARAKAAACRDLISRGIDPIEHQRRADEAVQQRGRDMAAQAARQAMTFGRYADDHFLPFVLPGFSNPAHVQQWQASFRVHAAALKDRPLAGITREDILAVLRPIWTAKPETASRTRQRLERLFAHAVQNSHFSGDNPAAWGQFNATLTPGGSKTVRNHPAVPYARMAEFMAAVRAKQADSDAALLLEWIALSAARTGEARFATWGEIDLTGRVWAIPAERMKMRRPHIVPITSRMMDILTEARRRHPSGPDVSPGDYVFVGPRGKPLTEMACLMLMRRMEAFAGFVPHGLRSSFKDWASEATDCPRELIEEQLAHQLGAVERAYKRGSAHERRRPLMEAWAAHCDGQSTNAAPGSASGSASGNVVHLRASLG
jgi:integrase